jgi:hypothetical protein
MSTVPSRFGDRLSCSEFIDSFEAMMIREDCDKGFASKGRSRWLNLIYLPGGVGGAGGFGGGSTSACSSR